MVGILSPGRAPPYCGVDGMDRKFHRLTWGLALLGCIGLAGYSLAQEGDTRSAPQPYDSAPRDSARAPSPLVADPKTPEELLEATLMMVDIARPDLAKLYLDKLISQNPDDDTILALRDQFGAAALLRLTNV